jgi:hypothetical protein
MLDLPSALELESLSDSELMERITAATKAIKEASTIYGDDSDEQRLYRSLITDQNRRKANANNPQIDSAT